MRNFLFCLVLLVASSAFAGKSYPAICECSVGGMSAGSGDSRAEALEDAVENCRERTQEVKRYEGTLDCDGSQYAIDVLTFHKQFNCQRSWIEDRPGAVGNCEY